MFSAGAPFDTKYTKPIFKQMLSPCKAECTACPVIGRRTGKQDCHIFPAHAEEGTCHPGHMQKPSGPRSQVGWVLGIRTGQSLILAMYVPWAYAVVQPKSVLPWQPCVTWCHTCYISKSLYIAFATKHTLQYVIWTLVHIARLWMRSRHYLFWNRCLKPRQCNIWEGRGVTKIKYGLRKSVAGCLPHSVLRKMSLLDQAR